MATFFCHKLFADSRIHKWDRGIISTCESPSSLSGEILSYQHLQHKTKHFFSRLFLRAYEWPKPILHSVKRMM